MAAGPLALNPSLRPWYAAGLRYVYFDDDALEALEASRVAHAVPDAQTTQSASPSNQSNQSKRLERGQEQPSTAARYADRMPPQSVVARRGQVVQKVESHANQSPAQQENPQAHRLSRTMQEGPQATTMPPEQWPQIWQDRLASTLATAKGAPVLWTYWALGEDLSGAPNAPRRDILRRILGELNLPRGTHCFWPVAMPSSIPHFEQSQDQRSQHGQEGAADMQAGIELQANAPIFLAGLDILAPRVCVIMGSKALRTIMPNSTTGPFQQTQYGRMLFLVLPDMDMLLAESERIPRVVAYLRSALQPFMGRK